MIDHLTIYDAMWGECWSKVGLTFSKAPDLDQSAKLQSCVIDAATGRRIGEGAQLISSVSRG